MGLTRFKIMIFLMLVLSLLAGSNANPRMDCSECLDEMHGLNQLIQMGGQTIEDFLITNYCPTVSPDPNSHIQCERDLAGNYVILLEMVVEHFFVEGAEHICKAMGVCPIRDSDRLPKTAEYNHETLNRIFHEKMLGTPARSVLKDLNGLRPT